MGTLLPFSRASIPGEEEFKNKAQQLAQRALDANVSYGGPCPMRLRYLFVCDDAGERRYTVSLEFSLDGRLGTIQVVVDSGESLEFRTERADVFKDMIVAKLRGDHAIGAAVHCSRLIASDMGLRFETDIWEYFDHASGEYNWVAPAL
jgi:hypothetical protein